MTPSALAARPGLAADRTRSDRGTPASRRVHARRGPGRPQRQAPSARNFTTRRKRPALGDRPAFALPRVVAAALPNCLECAERRSVEVAVDTSGRFSATGAPRRPAMKTAPFWTSSPPSGPKPADIRNDLRGSSVDRPYRRGAYLQGCYVSSRLLDGSLKIVVSPVRFRPSPPRSCGASPGGVLGRSRAEHASLPASLPGGRLTLSWRGLRPRHLGTPLHSRFFGDQSAVQASLMVIGPPGSRGRGWPA